MTPSIHMPHHPADSSPRDWTEDAAHENGSYLCRCVHCHEVFTGHKRRAVCKACHTRDAETAKARAEWLHAHNAPKDWVILTIDEVRAMHAQYADLLLRYHVEAKLRRESVAAIVRINDAAAIFAPKRGALHYPIEDAMEIVREAQARDRVESLSTVAPQPSTVVP